MGAGQSRSVAANHNNASHSRRQEASTYEHAAFQKSSRKTSSQPSSPSSSKSHRHHAVRHRESPAAAPNSRREFLKQQQQLVQEEYFIADAAGHDADLAHEDYLSYAAAEVPGYFYNDGSAAYCGPPLQRSRAVRTGTAPTPRDGSRRKAMIHGEREQQCNARAGISGFSRRTAQGEADNYYHPMEVPAALTQPQPQYAPHYQPHSSYSAPRYMVRPRPAGHAHASRFHEEF